MQQYQWLYDIEQFSIQYEHVLVQVVWKKDNVIHQGNQSRWQLSTG